MYSPKDYANKKPEWRKARLISKYMDKSDKILDFGCGPGEYGPYLKLKCATLSGLDIEQSLLDIAKGRGYDRLLCKDIKNRLPFKEKEFDSLWCSEVLEHFPSLKIVDELERVTKDCIIITVPNPLSPHFKGDETHILKYNVSSLKRFFSNRKDWNYKIRGLGFDDIPVPLIFKRFTTILLWNVPLFSPTIAIIGKRPV